MAKLRLLGGGGLPRGPALLMACAGLLFILRLVVAARMPLVPDEAYYWLWSRHLQWGYLDHPFMVAFWIRLGTLLWGDTPFGVRFAGLASFGLAIVLFYRTATRFFPHRDDAGRRGVLLFSATLMAGVGLVPATPDAPLLLFLVMALWALSHLVKRDEDDGEMAVGPCPGRAGWWMACGTSLGLAADSKYTAVLWGMGLAGFVVFGKKKLWRQAGPWLGGLCALFVVSPTLIWNGQHHWAGLLKQGGRTIRWQPERAGQFLVELLAGQLALLTPWVAVLCLLGLWRARQRSGLLFWLCLPAALVFSLHVTGERVQPNWTWVLYPALLLAGAGYAGRIGGAVLLGQGCTLLVYVQALTGILPLPAHMDPVARLSAGWEDLARTLVVQAHEAGLDTLTTDDYALGAILAFQKPEGLTVLGSDARWRMLSGLKECRGKTALLVRDARYGPARPGEWTVRRYGHEQAIRLYHLEKREQEHAWSLR